MDSFFLELALVTYLFGPSVAIPFVGDKMDIVSIGFFVLSLQAITIFLLFYLLDLLDYTSKTETRLVRRFSEITKKEIDVLGNQATLIVSRFHKEGGHKGYYFALLFISFAIGFTWAVVLSYSLRLRRMYSYPPILMGSALSFLFWYGVLSFSLNFITANIFMILSIFIGVFLLLYGRIREKAELYKLSHLIRLVGRKTKNVVKNKLRKKQKR
ncbi:hypothetical protein K8R43_02050 [archaeon]|nr:hypothetical protein [archaeon]